jgi:hypothetical protein
LRDAASIFTGFSTTSTTDWQYSDPLLYVYTLIEFALTVHTMLTIWTGTGSTSRKRHWTESTRQSVWKIFQRFLWDNVAAYFAKFSPSRVTSVWVLGPLKCSDVIPAGIVWDVVCRWQGMRVLYDLYCNSAINEAYSTVTSPFFLGEEATRSFPSDEVMTRDPALQPPSGPTHAIAEEMSPKQRNQSYQRFYKALTIHWISAEIFWLLRARPVQSPPEFLNVHSRLQKDWSDNETRSLPDKLDIVEVTEFVWGFLGRKPFHVSSVPVWPEGLDEDVLEEFIPAEDEMIVKTSSRCPKRRKLRTGIISSGPFFHSCDHHKL